VRLRADEPITGSPSLFHGVTRETPGNKLQVRQSCQAKSGKLPGMSQDRIEAVSRTAKEKL